MEVQGILSAIKQSYSGISSQLKRMEVISENIANAEALPDQNGNLYHKKVALLKNKNNSLGQPFGEKLSLKLTQSNAKHLALNGSNSKNSGPSGIVQNTYEIVEVEGEKIIHDPTNPRADENGYVKMPNISVVEEMVDLMSTSRAYEANITVLTASKAMAKKTFEI